VLVALSNGSELRRSILLCLLILILCIPVSRRVAGWSNGGKSTDPMNPKYGTHDFIAQHALDWLPNELDSWLRNNLATYLYGTELPDLKDAVAGDGIGDVTNHHVYFGISGQLEDNASARRAQESFDQVRAYLASKDYVKAAKWIGVTSHYIDDLAVFGHVMGKSTVWGSEKHHSDYEDWVQGRTNKYNASFTSCLKFDGSLEPAQGQTTAYAITIDLAHDTTFDDTGKGHNATWLESHYDPHDPTFQMRTCELLNHAVNAVADAIYLVAQTANVSEFSVSEVVLAASMILVTVPLASKRTKSREFN